MSIPAATAAGTPSDPIPKPASQPTASALQVKCPGCQASLKLAKSMAGRVVKCSKCGTQMKVPGQSPAAANPPAPAGRPAASKPTPTTTAPSSLFDDGDDPFADLPTSAPSSAGGGFGAPATAGGYNPYGPPKAATTRAPRKAGGLPSGRSAVLYTVPGVLMLLWTLLVVGVGIFQIGMVIYVIASGQIDMARINWPRFAGMMTGRVLGLLFFASVSAGAVAMIRRNNLGMAKYASVVIAIPCFGLLACPFGIWACVLLFSDKATRDFR